MGVLLFRTQHNFKDFRYDSNLAKHASHNSCSTNSTVAITQAESLSCINTTLHLNTSVFFLNNILKFALKKVSVNRSAIILSPVSNQLIVNNSYQKQLLHLLLITSYPKKYHHSSNGSKVLGKLKVPTTENNSVLLVDANTSLFPNGILFVE